MFHKHDWKLVSEFTTKSRLEIYADAGYRIPQYYGNEGRKKYIQIFKCKCGKVKKFTTRMGY